jgi:hypothetical protein
MVEWGRNYVALTLRNDRDHAKAREVSVILQRQFEAEHRYHEDPHEVTEENSSDQTRKRKGTRGRAK